MIHNLKFQSRHWRHSFIWHWCRSFHISLEGHTRSFDGRRRRDIHFEADHSLIITIVRLLQAFTYRCNALIQFSRTPQGFKFLYMSKFLIYTEICLLMRDGLEIICFRPSMMKLPWFHLYIGWENDYTFSELQDSIKMLRHYQLSPPADRAFTTGFKNAVASRDFDAHMPCRYMAPTYIHYATTKTKKPNFLTMKIMLLQGRLSRRLNWGNYIEIFRYHLLISRLTLIYT